MSPRLRWLIVLAASPGCGGTDSPRPEVLASVPGDAHRGEAAIERYGCGACHVIPGVRRARGKVGPPLSDFVHRTYIAGNVFNTPNNLAAWIRRPDSIEPGTVMPALGVTAQDARDISAYLLLETSTGSDGPPRLLSPGLIHGE